MYIANPGVHYHHHPPHTATLLNQKTNPKFGQELYRLLNPPFQAFRAAKEDASLGYDIITGMITSSGLHPSFKMHLLDELPTSVGNLMYYLGDERHADELQKHLEGSWNRFSLRGGGGRHH